MFLIALGILQVRSKEENRVALINAYGFWLSLPTVGVAWMEVEGTGHQPHDYIPEHLEKMGRLRNHH